MITAKEMREVFDSFVDKKLDDFLDGIMVVAMLNQKQAPVDIDVSAIQKHVGSNRTDLVDMAIKVLERNGYTARIETILDGGYIVAVVRVWW